MPCLCRMNRYIIKGLLWLYILSTGLFVVSLEPGYLDFDNLPDTNFSCVGKVIGGYYADLETNCQMFHVCTIGQLDEPMDIRFLCLNGTVFDQETRVCERIDEVDCSKSEKFYSLNLELYGNTAPPIVEENETEAPKIEKPSSTTTTTTTTTTSRPSSTTTPRTQYFTSSARPLTPSPYHKGPSSHHFSLEQPPSYTPEEINISLNPGAPPNIRTKPFEFPQHNSYSDNIDSNNKKTVSTPSSVFDSEEEEEERSGEDNSRFSSSTTEIAQNNFNQHVQHHQQNVQHSLPSQNNFKYNFNYHDTRPRDYNPSRASNYQYHHNYANFRPSIPSNNPFQNNPYRSSTQRNEYLPVTRKTFEPNHPSSTSRSFFLQPLKSPSHQYFTRTEKPQGDKLPVPVLPTLSPIVFSSPAPFALSRHVETKRYTDEHELPPRIIISASASVSDANGRTLNYSLGTIGAAKILAQPPASYDDYKEEDVVLDPFYHDVPKIQEQGKRQKRETSGNGVHNGQSGLNADTSSESKRSSRAPQHIDPSQIIMNEEEAVEVLKFLFDWYKTHEKTTKIPINIPVNPELISTINEQFSKAPYVTEDYEDEQNLDNSAKLDDFSSSKRQQSTSIQQATKGPSSSTKIKEGNFDEPNDSKYEDVKVYDERTRNVINNFRNTQTPPSKKGTSRRRPDRGRHRFTFPNLTTRSPDTQEALRYEDQLKDNKRRAQNPSRIDYEEFYERSTSSNNVLNGLDNRNFDGQRIHHGNNDYLNNRFVTNAIPFATSQRPFLQRFEETQFQPSGVATDEVTTHSGSTIKVESSTTQTTERTVKKSSDYINYVNDFELSKESTQKTTTEVYEASTQPYSYLNDYADDNYEPSIFAQNIGDDRLEKINTDEVRGAIHEETNINIDFTETPDERKYGNKEEETTIHESFSRNNSAEIEMPETTINSVSIDKNLTSFGDVVDSLRDYQKSEQEIYNYQQNLTEIREFESSSITQNEEPTTLNPFTSENTIFTEPSTQAEFNTEAKKTKNFNSNSIEEDNANFTKSMIEATENYPANDEPRLYTSKPVSIEITNYNHHSTKYEETRTITETPIPTTSQIYETTTDIIDSVEEKSEETLSTKENEAVTTEAVTTFEKETETTKKSMEEVTTTSNPKPRYRGRNRGLKRLFDYNRRVENMPVSGTYSGTTSRRRNSRRRQQNKPFYSQESSSESPSITTILTLTTDQMTTITDSSTDNVINIRNFILSAFGGKTSYESLPSSHLLNSTPKGFYVTKGGQESEPQEEFESSTSSKIDSTPLSHSTEPYSRTETNSIVSVEEVSSSISESQTNNYYISTLEQHTSSKSTGTLSESTTPTASSSNTIEEFTNYYTSTPSSITSTTEDKYSDTSTITSASDAYTTTEESKINTEMMTTTANTFTFNTLKIKEIEATTNSIADLRSTRYEENAVRYTEHVEDENESDAEEQTTESTTEDPTTEFQTETIQYEKDTGTTVSEIETEEPNTKIDAITQLNSKEESTTQNIEDKETEPPKTSIDNEINNEQNKEEPSTNRDGRKYKDRKLKPKSNKQRFSGNRFSSRHRFSSTNVTPRTGSRKNTYSHFRAVPVVTPSISTSVEMEEIPEQPEEEALTEIALAKNAKPTLATSKGKHFSTTPMLYKVQLRKEKVNKNFVFNCFGKTLNQFYSDPRDCRLFHYCTNGYSKNQLLDMKFVCDLGTHFDDEKLVCTSETPKRCL